MNRFAQLLVLLVFCGGSVAWAVEPMGVREFSAECAAHYARIHQVPVALVGAIIQVESDWNPYSVSVKGAAGLIGVVPLGETSS